VETKTKYPFESQAPSGKVFGNRFGPRRKEGRKGAKRYGKTTKEGRKGNDDKKKRKETKERGASERINL